MSEERSTTIKVKRTTHRRLYAEKLLRDTKTIDEAIDKAFRELDRKRKKSNALGSLGL